MQVDHFVGKQVDDFIIQERIGRGGMSVVYRAFQPAMNRSVALKIISLSSDGAGDEFRRRFAHEAELIAKLEHIHILPVYDYGIVNNELAYLAMRLLRGGSLGSLLSSGPLPLHQTADVFTQIARGLAYAHSKGIIHRDIKPTNILLDESGNAYITDFGLAKLVEDSLELTKAGNIVGTPVYMAPEQLRGENVDHRADVYSLGVVLYHMIAGRPPFDASDTNIISVIYQHLEKAPLPPSEFNVDVSPEVESIVMRALSKTPEDRFDSADQMAEELNVALGRKISTSSYPAVRPHSKPTLPVTPSLIARRQVRRRFWFAVGVGLLAAAIAIGALVITSQQPQSFPAAIVLEGEKADAAAAKPSDAEAERARARVGDRGFIAYIACNQSSEYHATQAREMGDIAARYGLRYTIYDSENDKSRQIPQIERARSDGASALIVCPLDIEILDATLTSAQEAGLPLVFMASNIPSYGGVLLAGNDYLMGLAAGRLAGKIIRDEKDGEANIIILDFPDFPSIVTRANGIEDGIREYVPDVNIIGRYLGGTQDNGENSVRRLLEQQVAFDVIVSINDAGAFGAINALEDAEVDPESVVISSIDAEQLARSYIRSGYFMRGSVDVGRQKFSETAVNAVVKLLAGATLPETYLVPPGQSITRDMLSGDETR